MVSGYGQSSSEVGETNANTYQFKVGDFDCAAVTDGTFTHAAVDMLPDQLAKTRRALLARAAKEKSLIMMLHFPFPGLGCAWPKGGGWQWKPQI